MNIQDAIKSGRPFRRAAWPNKNLWIRRGTDLSGCDSFMDGMGGYMMPPEDVIADDWELKEETPQSIEYEVTFTFGQCWIDPITGKKMTSDLKTETFRYKDVMPQLGIHPSAKIPIRSRNLTHNISTNAIAVSFEVPLGLRNVDKTFKLVRERLESQFTEDKP